LLSNRLVLVSLSIVLSVLITGVAFLLYDRLTDLDTSISDLSNKTLENEERFNLLAEEQEVLQLAILEDRISVLLLIDEIGDRVDGLQVSLDEGDRNREALQAQISQLQTQIEELESLELLIEELRLLVDQGKRDRAALEGQLDDLRAGLDELASLELEFNLRVIERLSLLERNVFLINPDEQNQFPPRDPFVRLSCSNPFSVFEDSFEYTDSIKNHGWIQISTAGGEATQETVAAIGERALRLEDVSSDSENRYIRPMPLQNATFQIDFYLRSEQEGQVVLLAIWGNEFPNGRDNGILAELSDNNRLRIQNRMFFTFELNTWYHVRLVVSPEEGSFDVYVDDMVMPLVIDVPFTDVFFDKILIHTATGGTGTGYWDGILLQKCN